MYAEIHGQTRNHDRRAIALEGLAAALNNTNIAAREMHCASRSAGVGSGWGWCTTAAIQHVSTNAKQSSISAYKSGMWPGPYSCCPGLADSRDFERACGLRLWGDRQGLYYQCLAFSAMLVSTK